MQESGPLLVRVFFGLNRVMSALWRGFLMIRDETLWAWTSQEERERTNRTIYAHLEIFYPGGDWFEEGLFDWEREVLASPQFPTSGRILLGAAGGGRELAVLCKMGYDVTAFEPATELAEVARAVAAPYPASKVICASFADLRSAVENGAGPLAPHVCGQGFDAIILGWTSFSYVWREQRVPLLQTLRLLAPRAPVLLSYLDADTSSQGRLDRVRVWFRSVLRVTGAPALAEPGDAFQVWMGFFQTLTPEEIRSLALRTGYWAIDASVSGTTPYALLLPNQER